MFKRGLPPDNVSKAWLLIASPSNPTKPVVELAVRKSAMSDSDDHGLYLTDKWACTDVDIALADTACTILGWAEYEIPACVLEPLAVFDVFTDRGFFLHKQAAKSKADAVRIARQNGQPLAALAKLTAGESTIPQLQWDRFLAAQAEAINAACDMGVGYEEIALALNLEDGAHVQRIREATQAMGRIE